MDEKNALAIVVAMEIVSVENSSKSYDGSTLQNIKVKLYQYFSGKDRSAYYQLGNILDDARTHPDYDFSLNRCPFNYYTFNAKTGEKWLIFDHVIHGAIRNQVGLTRKIPHNATVGALFEELKKKYGDKKTF